MPAALHKAPIFPTGKEGQQEDMPSSCLKLKIPTGQVGAFALGHYIYTPTWSNPNKLAKMFSPVCQTSALALWRKSHLIAVSSLCTAIDSSIQDQVYPPRRRIPKTYINNPINQKIEKQNSHKKASVSYPKSKTFLVYPSLPSKHEAQWPARYPPRQP